MALRLPPLAALRLFEAAGRLQSFKLAAEELRLTPSAVSHGIVALERWLGVSLFERRTNGVILTSAGKDYLAFVSEALAMIAVGTRRLPSAHGARRVSISLPPTFASRWLLPRIAEFRLRCPEIALTFDTSHRQVGFPVDNVDLAVRMARAPWPDLPSTCLFTERLVPVCSQEFLSRHNVPLDLTAVPLLHVASTTEDWAAWLEATGAVDIDLSSALNFDTVHMATDAAVAGLGVAMGRRPLIDPELANGRLVVAAAPEIEATTGYWLVQGSKADDRPEVKAVASWFVDAASPGNDVRLIGKSDRSRP